MMRWLKKRPTVALSVLILVAVLGSISGYVPVDRAGRVVIRPITAVLNGSAQGVSRWFGEAANIGSLSDANNQLRQENDDLRQKLSEFNSTLAENELLKAQLKWQTAHRTESVSADITNYQPDSVRHFVRIGAGRKQGLKVGQPVMAGGYLVGAITAVDGSTSEVMLVTDGEFRVLVKTAKDGIPGLLRGRPPQALVMERIPRDKIINNDELVVTSGLDGQFPAGILVGSISSVSASAEAIFQVAQIQPALDLARLRSVSVLKY